MESKILGKREFFRSTPFSGVLDIKQGLPNANSNLNLKLRFPQTPIA
jgi:hypothetical protein